MSINRILLPFIGQFRNVKIDGMDATIRDGSALSFQVQEMIASGACKRVLRDDELSQRFTERLHPTLKLWIELVDPNQASFQKALAILSPIAEEIGVGLPGRNWDGLTKPLQCDNETMNAFVMVFFSLPNWILSVDCQLQLDLPIEDIVQSLQVLRNKIRSEHGRTNLSVLHGVFASYRQSTVDSITLQPLASEDHIELFGRFLEDETYRELSTQCHDFGYLDWLKRATTVASRLIRDLLKKPFARQTTDLSSRAFSTATQIPTLDSNALGTLFSEHYLPPIISLDDAMRRADELWMQSDSKIVNPTAWLDQSEITD